MSDTRNLFTLQTAGLMARNSIDAQKEYASQLLEQDLTESQRIIKLERKFFLPRNQALEIFACQQN